jgi:hypothetical protein
MISLPTIHDTPQSIDSAIGNNKSAGWLKGAMADPNLFIVVALCVIGLLVTLNLIFRFPSFQPSTDQIALLLG